MVLKLVNANNEVIEKTYEDFIKDVHHNSFFYFSKETSYKDLKDLVDKLQELGYRVMLKEVKFALDEGAYMYELHIIE
jgi:hypothetical protein